MQTASECITDIARQ